MLTPNHSVYIRSPDDGSRIHVFEHARALTVLVIHPPGTKPTYTQTAVDAPTLNRKRRAWLRSGYYELIEEAA